MRLNWWAFNLLPILQSAHENLDGQTPVETREGLLTGCFLAFALIPSCILGVRTEVGLFGLRGRVQGKNDSSAVRRRGWGLIGQVF